ncbi:Probable CtpA-like serine protease [Aedoeadaptatus ivorii]|uniref:Probable CtpA-like serine protease n=1 Tax=Aedoeadaptatus ivorii TaxID=54006 RepID=A0A3S5AJM2_9FIRM|nr:S41 family peptidase [Peptoniphilus ivorii]VEJ35835.1 Probable CtpA-like serine protease [Peptoniphilus ivorii]
MKKRTVILFVLLLAVSNIATAFASVQFVTGDVKEVMTTRALERFLKKNYLRAKEISDEDFEIGRRKGTVEALNDPYSEYFTEEEYNSFVEATTGEFFGIGVQIGADANSKMITVIAPIKGSPAEAAGIQSGDKIVSVNGIDYTAEDLEEAVKHIKGDKGTTVKLGILPKDGGELKEVEVKRDEIRMESVITADLGDIAYIGLTQFEDDTLADFKAALNRAKTDGKKGLILDLRGNPGGILEAAVGVSDLLLGEGDIVSAKDNRGKEVFHYASDADRWEKPLAVLANGGSASASEIVSGAIKDHKAGTLVGEKTFGKGVVQSLLPLPGGGGLKLTTSEYFTPSGVNIQDKGIEPDVKVALPKEVTGIGPEYKEQDTQLQKAIEIIEKSDR